MYEMGNHTKHTCAHDGGEGSYYFNDPLLGSSQVHRRLATDSAAFAPNIVGTCCAKMLGIVCIWSKMLDIVGYCWVMLEWFSHPTQQIHILASAMVKTGPILNSYYRYYHYQFIYFWI